MQLVMFDIDGTLTQTDEADSNCYLQALADVFGFADVDADWSRYPQCTDGGILAHLFHARLQRPPSAAEIAVFQARFFELLEAAASVQPFHPIAGAREFLAMLEAKHDCRLALASGDWERSARSKLASAGLDCNRFPAAFADDGHSREEIMQLSLQRAIDEHEVQSFTRHTYIGDGVWDARAARKSGFRFIGIANDERKIKRLKAEGAVAVFPDYLAIRGF